MTSKDILNSIVGQSLPTALRNIKWTAAYKGCIQSDGEDPLGNEWNREPLALDDTCDPSQEKTKTIPPYRIGATLTSNSRNAVYLPVFLTVSADDIIEEVSIEAYASYGPGHGRPQYLNPNAHEKNQIRDLLHDLLHL